MMIDRKSVLNLQNSVKRELSKQKLSIVLFEVDDYCISDSTNAAILILCGDNINFKAGSK